MQKLRHLVVGTDFSADADAALALASALASAAAAQLTVVHVCELGVDGHDEELLAHRAAALSALVSRPRRDSVPITAVLRSGRPAEKLDNVAVEVGAAVIVIGRQGADRGLGEALGSVAARLVRCASRPVLTVPYPLDRLVSEASDPAIQHGKNR
jgi:nucleotide-binding universal stress UspA family protein